MVLVVNLQCVATSVTSTVSHMKNNTRGDSDCRRIARYLLDLVEGQTSPVLDLHSPKHSEVLRVVRS